DTWRSSGFPGQVVSSRGDLSMGSRRINAGCRATPETGGHGDNTNNREGTAPATHRAVTDGGGAVADRYNPSVRWTTRAKATSPDRSGPIGGFVGRRGGLAGAAGARHSDGQVSI